MPKRIKLTNGGFAIIDNCDYEFISSFSWHGIKDKRVETTIYDPTKKSHCRAVSMGRLIMGEPMGFMVDHINGNPLDNRRKNLRIVTAQQNAWNSRKCTKKKSSSKYKGVYFRPLHTKKWWAQIVYNREHISLGGFSAEKDAANAYNATAKKLFGEYACLNAVEK